MTKIDRETVFPNEARKREREEAMRRANENFRTLQEGIGRAFAEATETIRNHLLAAVAPTSPAPDLARDDAQSEVPSDVLGQDCGHPKHVSLRQIPECLLSTAQIDADRLRSELADMTAERDRVEGYWQSSSESIGETARALERAVGRERAEEAADLPGMVELLRRRAEAAETGLADALAERDDALAANAALKVELQETRFGGPWVGWAS